MAIAAALNILVSAPRAELVGDLKKIGATVGELKKTIGDLHKRGATEAMAFKRAQDLVNIALKNGSIGAQEFDKYMKLLSQDFTGATADMAKLRAEAIKLNNTFNDPKARFDATKGRLDTMRQIGLRGGGAAQGGISQEAYVQRMSQLVKQYEDETGMTQRMLKEQQMLKDDAATQEQARLARQASARKAFMADAALGEKQQAEHAAKVQADVQNKANMKADFLREQALNQFREDKQAELAEAKRIAALQADIVARSEAERAATAKLNAEKSRSRDLFRSLNPALQSYHTKVHEYKQLLRTTAMTQAQFNVLMAQARKEYTSQTSFMGKTFGKTSQLLSATGLFNPWLVVVSGIGLAVKESMAFEKELSKVAAVSNLTSAELHQLGAAAKGLSGTTLFSPTQVAEASKFLAQAGLEVSEIMDVLPHVLDLATAGEMDLANASEIAVRIMGAMEMDTQDFVDVVDALAVGAGESVASIENLAEALKFVGPLGHQAGQGLDEIMAALMTLHDKGIVGEMAGTGMRNIYLRMANLTDEGRAAMDRLGISFATTKDGAFDLVQIVKDFNKAMEGMSGVEKLDIIGDIYKDRSGSTFTGLLGAGEAELQKNLDLQRNKGGAGRRQADTIEDNLSGDLRKVWDEILVFGVDLANLVNPALRGLATALKPVISVLGILSVDIQMIFAGLKTAYYLFWEAMLDAVKKLLQLMDKIPGVDVSGMVNMADGMHREFKAERQRSWQRTKELGMEGADRKDALLNSVMDGTEYEAPSTKRAREKAEKDGFQKWQEQELAKAHDMVQAVQTETEMLGKSREEKERMAVLDVLANVASKEARDVELALLEINQQQRTEKERSIELGKEEETILESIRTAKAAQFVWEKEQRDLNAVDTLTLKYLEDGILTNQELINIELAKQTLAIDEQLAKDKERVKTSQQLLDNLVKEGQQLRESLNPLEKYKQEFIKIETMRQTGSIDDDEAKQATAKAQEQFFKSQAGFATAGGATEKGSAEDFALRQGSGNPMLEVAKKQLEKLHRSVEVQDKIAANTAAALGEKPKDF